MRPFSEFWSRLQSELGKGTEIRNWTAKNGYLGDSFTVAGLTSAHVEIDAPGAETVQRVPKSDFEAVYAQWTRYCAGAVQRQQIRDTTRFSKYIISIVHHLEPSNVVREQMPQNRSR